MEFGWDPAKDARTFRERGFGFAYVIRIFAGPVMEIVDRRRDYGEERIRAIGEVDGRAYVVVYTDRRVGRILGTVDHQRVESERQGSAAMAKSRMTLAEALAASAHVDLSKVDATTDADIRRHMMEDGFDPDEDIRDEDIISPAHIRKRLGMSQRKFAGVIKVPLATLQNWEQGRTLMDPSARSLMQILACEPEAALRALGYEAAA
jgi:putative transcriptional regulator